MVLVGYGSDDNRFRDEIGWIGWFDTPAIQQFPDSEQKNQWL